MWGPQAIGDRQGHSRTGTSPGWEWTPAGCSPPGQSLPCGLRRGFLRPLGSTHQTTQAGAGEGGCEPDPDALGQPRRAGQSLRALVFGSLGAPGTFQPLVPPPCPEPRESSERLRCPPELTQEMGPLVPGQRRQAGCTGEVGHHVKQPAPPAPTPIHCFLLTRSQPWGGGREAGWVGRA